MTDLLPILLAIGQDPDEPDRLAGRWAPALEPSGLRAEGIWCPGPPDAATGHRAAGLARALGVPIQHTDPAPAAAVLTTARGPALREILARAAERDLPVLLDRPCADPPEVMRDLLAPEPPSLLLGHHLNHHHGFTRVLRAVHAAEIGLLRAVALDLVTSDPAGNTEPVDVLRDLGAQVIDLLRALSGPSALRLRAWSGTQGCWTLLGQSERDVVVSAHLSRLHGTAATVQALLRVTGTDGSLTADLTGPALQVRTAAGTTPLPYGEGPQAAVLTRLAAVARGAAPPDPPEDLLVLTQALGQLERTIPPADPITLTW